MSLLNYFTMLYIEINEESFIGTNDKPNSRQLSLEHLVLFSNEKADKYTVELAKEFRLMRVGLCLEINDKDEKSAKGRPIKRLLQI